jgi:hypothetical protein
MRPSNSRNLDPCLSVLPCGAFDACREKVPRVSILSSVQDVDRSLGIRTVAVAKAMRLSHISANTQRGGLFDDFSRRSIIYWVASTSHPQPLILSEADCALKHEMRKLAGLKLWHATSCHDHPRIGSGAPVAASVLVCLDE